MDLPFSEYIKPNLAYLAFAINILVIILIIAALAGGGVTGSGTMAALSFAVIFEFTILALKYLYT
jgi:hypothetical protein